MPGFVLYIQITLENGERTIRDRALLRNEWGRFFVDSIQADVINVLFCKSRNDEFPDEKFCIVVLIQEEVELPEKFSVKIGDATLKLEQVGDLKFRITDILRGGFVKSGHPVEIVKF